MGRGGGVGLGGRVGWGRTGCKRRIEVFVKIQKKNRFGGGPRGSGWGWGSGWGGGVSVDVNEELKFFVKIFKKWEGLGGGRVGGGG